VTSEIRRVVSYLGPNQVAEGFYTFDGSTLTMMGDDGKGNWSPMFLDEEPVTETVTPEHAEAVAKKLTRRIRKAFRGETVEGFGRALTYEREAFA
jgi:hypothetical protein